MAIEVGQEAPDFELKGSDGETHKLSDHRGKDNVVLVFYPFTFTGVCQGELCSLRDNLERFASANAQVYAISCDTVHAQKKWAEEQGFSFPVLADFWPHGEVSRAYGVFNEVNGAAVRGTFIVNKEGKVAAAFQSADLKTPRSQEEYEKALAQLS
jgi:peroxiredoxin